MARFVATLVALLPLANAQSEWKSVCIQSTEVTLAPDGRRHAAVDCKWGGGDATRLTTMPEISPFILSKTVTLGVEGHMIEKVSNSEFPRLLSSVVVTGTAVAWWHPNELARHSLVCLSKSPSQARHKLSCIYVLLLTVRIARLHRCR